MSGFHSDRPKYPEQEVPYGWSEQPSQGSYNFDMSGSPFGQELNFQTFDAAQNAESTYAAGPAYAAANPYLNPSGVQSGYQGDIFTPRQQPVAKGFAGDGVGENFEDEPPLLEELGINPDHIVQKPELILKHGYPVEVHTLSSEDGYLLTLHRIPFSSREPESKLRPIHHNLPWFKRSYTKEYHKQWPRYDSKGDEKVPKRPVVFLQHGVFASSLDWVLTGPGKALGYSLADAGYDVWLGNLRGNIYSSEHVNMSRNDANFWNFSWHEIGLYDLPAMIDYVLVATGHPSLQFVGHSMGATTAVVMLSERPQYNLKLDFTVLLAPVVKLQHNTSVLRFSARFWKALQSLTGYSGMHGFPPTPETLQRNLQPVCEDQFIGSGLCAKILYTVAGYAKQLNQTLLPTLFGHYPTQTSIKTMSHFMQGMHTGNFTKYDHGLEENMLRYNQSRPPEYDLTKITTQTVIFYGDSDPFTDAKDLSWLADELPNMIGSFRVQSESFSHLSFLWATDVDTVLYAPLIHLLAQLRRH